MAVPRPSPEAVLTNDYTNCIYEDKNGRLWLGTKGGGISVLNPRNNKVEQLYTVKEGLAHDIVCAILPGKDEELWISTDNGLSRLNCTQKSFENFHLKDGLHSNEFNPGAALAGKDGKLYFGGQEGIVSFYPDHIPPQSAKPSIMLTKLVQHNGRSNKIEETAFAIHDLKKIALHYKDQFFTLYFTLKDYYGYADARCQFAYQLEGLTQEWQTIGPVNYIQFASLPAGNYTLKIKGMGSNGIWGKEFRIPVTIGQAFYATTPAYVIYALVVLFVTGAVYWSQISHIRLQNKLQLEHLQKEKLEELDRLKSQFFTNITHEFRTPLTLIISPLEELLEQKTLPEPKLIRQQHNVIYRSAQHLLRLINQLLDLARLEAGNMSLSESQGNIVLFVESIIDAFRLQADKKSIKLEYKPDKIHKECLFDMEKMEKIVCNLLSNALKFTASGGAVTIELFREQVKKRKDWFYLRVTDTGMGIPAEELPFIFNRFHQVENNQTQYFQGSGLGLFLVKELTELMGGNVEVKSQEGQGTAFTVALPLQEAHKSISAMQPSVLPVIAPVADRVTTGGLPHSDIVPLVLVVEDNDELRSFIASGLAAKYRVITAQNGKEGWQSAQHELPDLVIADVTMPEMDGFVLSELIKNTPLTTHIAVILLTARASFENRLRGLNTGANDYLTKPFNLQELHLRIANLLNYQLKLRRYWQQQTIQPHAKELTEPVMEPVVEDPFLLAMYEVLDRELANSGFTIEELAGEMTISTRTLHRKVTAITGMNATELIRSYRLNKAALLLKEGYSVSDTAYQVGFEGLSYFSKCLKAQFSLSPSEYSVSASN